MELVHQQELGPGTLTTEVETSWLARVKALILSVDLQTCLLCVSKLIDRHGINQKCSNALVIAQWRTVIPIT